jgi:hypothetical protein
MAQLVVSGTAVRTVKSSKKFLPPGWTPLASV